MSVMEDYRAELAASTERLLETAAGLDDEDVRAPSLLPGWTIGHVLAHVARNGDSYVNLLTWARTGVRTPQYPSLDAREAAIAAGAVRPVRELVDDLRMSAERLERAIESTPPSAWRATVSAMRPPPHPAWYVPMRRLREVEVHHSDLGTGYGWRDWPDAYVRWDLYDTMLSWPYGRGPVSEIVAREPAPPGSPEGSSGVRVWRGLGDGPSVEGAPRELLAWLTGRSAGQGLSIRPPEPPPWLALPAPPGLPSEPPSSWPPADD
ncbi:maleylpyruvate isomerase family mycothiol-dependent enzyme [Microbispora sp. ATCC PTA-5024]|uniref:maleylpyruvate isomerase family mycothiol-dependent enzyme n=1 Tax=Microbispora sp. ATCC PTA-5024 TaxID=316330 RepID=UPI0003DDCDA1|nr:maleylpyruvate isomerase family mycothiol-dependent enzyme [Microbispora sp. ATCC PTA-5024]ETK38169.1 hypothetical protein MPTA5024_00140 [Microbispora sp. ATCC PTA-5024]